MNQYEQRKKGREEVARRVYEHEVRQGGNTSYEQIKRNFDKRADKLDAHKDRNIKGGMNGD